MFVIEPSLLRALRARSSRRLDLWSDGNIQTVAVGVKDAGLDQMVIDSI